MLGFEWLKSLRTENSATDDTDTSTQEALILEFCKVPRTLGAIRDRYGPESMAALRRLKQQGQLKTEFHYNGGEISVVHYVTQGLPHV